MEFSSLPLVCGRPMRALRSCPSEMALAAAVSWRTGRRARLAMKYSADDPTSTSSTGSSDHASGRMTRMTPPLASASMTPRSQTLPTMPMSTCTS